MKTKRGKTHLNLSAIQMCVLEKKLRTLILTQASDATTCKATQAVRK